jgi:hypothetical protein
VRHDGREAARLLANAPVDRRAVGRQPGLAEHASVVADVDSDEVVIVEREQRQPPG